MKNPVSMLLQLVPIVAVMLLGLSSSLQAQETSSNKTAGSKVKIPAVGTRFDCRYKFEVEATGSAEADGEKLDDEGMEQKAEIRSEFSIKVLETSKDRIERVSVVFKVEEEIDGTESLAPPSEPPPPAPVLFDEQLKKQIKEQEEEAKKLEKMRKTVIGKAFTAIAAKDSIKLKDAEGKTVPDDLAKLIPVPDNNISQIIGLNNRMGEAPRSRLFDPGHGLVETLPWKELTKNGDSAELSKAAASAMINPGPGWKSSSVKSAQLLFLEQRQLHGVECKRLKLSIKASGAHAEPFGGLPSKSTISWVAEITLEEETGWIREFILSHETVTNSEGSFQEIQMKIDSKNIIKGKVIITPSR